MLKQAIIAYTTTAIVFFVVDFIWLSKMTSLFYRPRMANILMDQPNFTVAGLFYLVYVGGIIYFAVIPALNSNSWLTAVINGAILGLIAYGTYDMTNLATLKNWSLSVSIVDMVWGLLLTAMASSAGYFATSFILPKI
ncbi:MULTISPECIES: DUF2177 family protein [Pseudochrobactrum]|jgi:uncharacterized membrane protein|uniref:DUF2177 family protein n=1 Tax=Pseudochrobactrum TaxID=354349 RepID=UPI000484C6BB|nr:MULTISPECIES: DUF2177 family protein [unclassified Pseudochrobactrum]HWD13221.1 DUF2177 family protein [Pseudochrobactrum sp.]